MFQVFTSYMINTSSKSFFDAENICVTVVSDKSQRCYDIFNTF